VSELLHEHVEHFNAGVRTGDWDPMLAGFEDAAEMEFRGIPVGPFVGKEAIAAAYREQPPDDEMRVLDERREPLVACALLERQLFDRVRRTPWRRSRLRS